MGKVAPAIVRGRDYVRLALRYKAEKKLDKVQLVEGNLGWDREVNVICKINVRLDQNN